MIHINHTMPDTDTHHQFIGYIHIICTLVNQTEDFTGRMTQPLCYVASRCA